MVAIRFTNTISNNGSIQFSSYMFVAYQQRFIRVFDVGTRDQ